MFSFWTQFLEGVASSCSVEKVFLEICKTHRKTPVPEFLFHKVAGLCPATLLKRGSGRRR